ncbi:flagellin [Candidatus Arthromitus sp. SFB-rat-Yit]
MIINHNMNAMNAHRNMGSTTSAQGKSMEKLSSGLRINRAGDDAAGLAISEKMRSQIRGLNQASRNAQDGISMIQTAEGALSETHAIGQRMRELAVQSANGTYTDEDRELINQEFNQLKSEIDRIANDTEFNGSKVINGNLSSKEIVAGTVAKSTTGTGITTGMANVVDTDLEFGDEAHLLGEGSFTFNVAVDDQGVITIDLYDKSSFNDNKEYVMETLVIDDVGSDIGQTGKSVGATIGGVDFVLNLENLEKTKQINFTIENTAQQKDSGSGVELQVGANKDQMIGLSMENMGSRELGLGGVSVSTAEDSKDAIGRLDKAVSRISAQRADLGAAQNRLEHTIASTDNTAENLQAAESRIRDVDMAKEMMNLTKLNVLQQASQSMLAQANQAPQQVLSILR